MEKTDCRKAIEAFEAFLNAPDARGVEIAGALDHLRACPACRARASYLARLLAAENADEDVLTCEECEELLPGYLVAESLGDTAAPVWSRVVRHLEACPHCSAAHASLVTLVSPAYGESGAEPPAYPRPDLAFLRSPEPAAPPTPAASLGEISPRGPQADLWQHGVQGVYRLAAAIPVLIGQAAAAFGVLVAPLAVQLAPTPVYRRKGPLAPADEARDFIELLALPHPETNVTLKVSLGPVFEGRGSLALAVSTIEPPLPIAQARVILRDADGLLLEGAFTGDDGAVLFRDLDAGGYLVQVEHGGQAWEVPLSFAAA